MFFTHFAMLVVSLHLECFNDSLLKIFLIVNLDLEYLESIGISICITVCIMNFILVHNASYYYIQIFKVKMLSFLKLLN